MKNRFLLILLVGASSTTWAQTTPLERNGQYISVEPFAPNVVRVTLSMLPGQATAAPGPGINGQAAAAGWSHRSADGADVYTSNRMSVKVAPAYRHDPNSKPPDTAAFFSGSVPGTNITIQLPDGSTLVEMNGWQMAALNQKDDTLKNARGIKPADLPLFTVGASFVAPEDEHYYGLGENQEGYLDHRQRPITCAANYLAPASPSYCVPFLVTNKGYGILWDNPSVTTIYPAFDGETRWTSTLGRRVSFFVIAGKTTDEVYGGYRLLTGATPMLPKAAYGFIQCKQRYSTQAEVLSVAKGYRDRHLPLDIMVVDWFYYTKMGEYDFDKVAWPDPVAMNRELHGENVESMISVWPRFAKGSRYYDQILKNGWFEHYADGIPKTSDEPAPGAPIDGEPYDKAGSDIDTTNPEAARWWWNLVRDNIASKGFDFFWADETEPDLPPDGGYLSIGPGTEFFNVYPLTHTAALYDGVRRDLPKQRSLTLARDAFTGAQRNGDMFWSSDISPNWDSFARQIPTGLNVAASGIAYTGNDIGGWQDLPYRHVPAHKPLIDPASARDNVNFDDDYPELYVRWFQYGTFLPTMRTHGTRKHNEVWSYGTEAEPILEKYLKLRYALMPYLYSLGWSTHQTGAPFMRALFMDFGQDPNVADIRDEYMFGPALLVAPVTRQGAETRQVYLPAGTDWFNYWTNEKLHGGQTVTVAAPIDRIPLFARAGSILPMGVPVESTHGEQAIQQVKVYAGADTSFTLYNDDGSTYDYEKGKYRTTTLVWNERAQTLTQQGASAWDNARKDVVQVIR